MKPRLYLNLGWNWTHLEKREGRPSETDDGEEHDNEGGSIEHSDQFC